MVSSYVYPSHIICSHRDLHIRQCGDLSQQSNIHPASGSHPCPMGLGEKWKTKRLMDRGNDNLIRKAKAVCTNPAKIKNPFITSCHQTRCLLISGKQSLSLIIAWNEKHHNYNHSALPPRRQLHNLSGQSV